MKLLFVIITLLLYPILSLAAIDVKNTGIDITVNYAGLPSRSDISAVTGDVITALLGFIGSLFLLLIIAGGILWMTAAGSEEQIRKAKSMITAAMLGLVVVLLSYAIAKVIGMILSNI